MKKLLIVISVICLLLGVSGCNSTTTNEVSVNNTTQEEGKYPTKWNDEEFYVTEEDFDADIEKLLTWIDEYKKYEGKLDTVEGLLGFIETDCNKEYCKLYDKMFSYAYFGTSVFPFENKYQIAMNKFNDAMGQVMDYRSYIDIEMPNLPYEKRAKLFEDERLTKYKNYYSIYLTEDLEEANQEMLELFDNASISHGRIRDTFDTLANFEIPAVEYKTSNGETVEITNRNARSIMAEDKYTYQDKATMNDLWWKNVSQYKNTLTSLLEIDLLEQYSNAKVTGYESTKYQALDSIGFEEDIIQKLIDIGTEHSDSLERYFKLLADENGNYYYFSNYNTISEFKPGYVNYDDGVDMVIEALSVMGDEYTQILTEEFNSGHIDVYPADDKQPGAFETGNYAGLYPFIMFNYRGTFTDVSSLAHETGHACYDILCNRNQTMYDWGASVFTHEVASLTNEITFYQYMIENANNDEEKLFYLQKMLAMWSLNFFDTCYWQEFEDYCHSLVEAGEILDCEELADKWIELGKKYYGEDFKQGEYGRYRWLTLSNIHNNYYEYNYGTALCYATVLSQNMRNNIPGAKENYLEFLKTGASISSIEALQIAGIDIYDDSVYEQALSFFDEMVNNLEELAK